MQGQAESSPYPTPGEATVTKASDQRKTKHAPQATSAAQSGAGSGCSGPQGSWVSRAERRFLFLNLFCSLWREKPGAFLQPWKRRRRPVRWGS